MSVVGEKQSVTKLPRYPFFPLFFSFFFCIATLLLAFQSDVSGWCRFANLAGFLEELIGQDSRTLVDSAYETLVGFISIKDQSLNCLWYLVHFLIGSRHVLNSWQFQILLTKVKQVV